MENSYQQILPEEKVEKIYVDQSKYVIASNENAKKIIVILGSCVALIGYNKTQKKGFATHIFNPQTGKELLEELMKKLDKSIYNYELYLSGGNKIIDLVTLEQGKKNIETVENIMYIKETNKIHTKKDRGNTITLELDTGKIENKIHNKIEEYEYIQK